MGYVETSSPKGVLRSRRTAASCELQPYRSVKFNETRQILLQLLKRVCVWSERPLQVPSQVGAAVCSIPVTSFAL